MKKMFTRLSLIILLAIGVKFSKAQCVDVIELYEDRVALESGAVEYDVIGGSGIPGGYDAVGEYLFGLKGTKLNGIKFDARSLTTGAVDVEVAVFSVSAGFGPISVATNLGSVTVSVGTTLGTYEGTFASPILLEDGGNDAFMFTIDASSMSATDSIEVAKVGGVGAFAGANRIEKSRFNPVWPGAQAYSNMISVRPVIEYEINPVISSSTIDTCVAETIDFMYANQPAWDNRPYITNSSYNLNRSASHFEWDFDDGSTDGINMDASHTFASSGTYNVTLTTYFEGYSAVCSENATITVDIMAAPTADFTLPDNSSLTASFVNTTIDASAYEWSFGDGMTSTDTDPTNTYPANASYDIELVAKNAECSDTTTKTMVFSVGIEDMENENTLKIFPNPVGDNMNIGFVGGLEKETIVALYDVFGKKLAVETIQAGARNYSIKTTNLESGKYLLMFVNKDAHFTKTFVKL